MTTLVVQAQSSVTIYGILDVSVNQIELTQPASNVVGAPYTAAPFSYNAAVAAPRTTTKATGNNAKGAWASNRLGFRGTEDLGGGTSANFAYELELNSGTGALVDSTTEARQSWVGLKSGWGEIKVGRVYNPAFDVNVATNPGSGNNVNAGRVVYGASSLATDTNSITTTRSSGSVVYITPTFNGFTGKLISGTNETDTTVGTIPASTTTTTTTATTNALGGSLVYDNGPLMVGYGFHNIDKGTASGARNEKILGAAYKLGDATLLASTGKGETENAAGTVTAKKKATQVGARYSFGQVDTFLSFGNFEISNSAGSIESVKYSPTVSGGSLDYKGMQLGGMYNLSKRTGVYGIYGETKAKNNSDLKISEIAVGLRHSF